VLCLRLIGLSIDYYDGSKRKRKDSTPAVSKRPCSWDDAALDRLPSLLPTLGFCFHYGGCIVGPQFPFVVYRRFISMESFRLVRGENSNDKREVYAVPECGQAVLRCFLIGAFYMAISEIGKTILPPQYVGTVKYGVDLSFSQRLIYMIIAGKFVLHKYLGVWSMNEGACILVGLYKLKLFALIYCKKKHTHRVEFRLMDTIIRQAGRCGMDCQMYSRGCLTPPHPCRKLSNRSIQIPTCGRKITFTND
jgi:lysophospholipid acyltransferase 5